MRRGSRVVGVERVDCRRGGLTVHRYDGRRYRWYLVSREMGIISELLRTDRRTWLARWKEPKRERKENEVLLGRTDRPRRKLTS